MIAAWAPLAMLFWQPIELPLRMRLVMFLPLALCIAAVYRATRSKRVEDLPKSTALAFMNITLGMGALAVGAYCLYELVLWWS
ncbi:MAG: hypothetical protein KDA32_12410 [Phycisphaerales bacterium]|nr:hypothetical protein [Phycisphaerales bacterium]